MTTLLDIKFVNQTAEIIPTSQERTRVGTFAQDIGAVSYVYGATYITGKNDFGTVNAAETITRMAISAPDTISPQDSQRLLAVTREQVVTAAIAKGYMAVQAKNNPASLTVYTNKPPEPNACSTTPVGNSGGYSTCSNVGSTTPVGNSGGNSTCSNVGSTTPVGNSGDYSTCSNVGSTTPVGNSGDYSTCSNAVRSSNIQSGSFSNRSGLSLN